MKRAHSHEITPRLAQGKPRIDDIHDINTRDKLVYKLLRDLTCHCSLPWSNFKRLQGTCLKNQKTAGSGEVKINQAGVRQKACL